MHKKRINFAFILMLFLAGGIIARLFVLQVLQYDIYHALAKDQHEFYKILMPERGEILIQDFSQKREDNQSFYTPLATNKDFYQVYLMPNKIRMQELEKKELVEELAAILEIDKDFILKRMNKKDDPYELIKRKVTEAVAEQIRQLQAEGVGLGMETWRYYPSDNFAAHVSGFVGIADNKKIGQYGIEGYYQDDLKGESGFLSGEKDTSGYGIPFLDRKLKKAVDGTDLVLTIDQNIQFKAKYELEQAVEKYQAQGGSIIIMDPFSGAILAMTSLPDFNPNQYGKVENMSIFQNPVIQELYEPGSVFKPITMAAGLDAGKVTPEAEYEDKGRMIINGSLIGNVDGKIYGRQTMTQVLEKSLNTGAYYVQEQLGRDLFREYVLKFGFDQPTGIDLAGERTGSLSNLYTAYDIDLATISFGQGIAVTPMQLLSAIGAIANKGNLMKPFVVEQMIRSDGEKIEIQPIKKDRVISSEAAESLTKMLVGVVENGSARLAKLEGYNLAAKTGTAQVPDFKEGGYTEETIHSFVGYAPAFDPKFAVLIKLDKPEGARFAATTCSPIFKNLSKYLFSYFEIPPQ